MNVNDLRKLLKSSNNKLSVLSNLKLITQYNLSIKDFIDLVVDFLSDEEKLMMVKSKDMEKLNDSVKASILTCISDKNICTKVLEDENLTSKLNTYHVIDIIKKANEEEKMKILYNPSFLKAHDIKGYDIEEIISGLSDESKIKILHNPNFFKNNNMTDYYICKIISSLENKNKQEIMNNTKLVLDDLKISKADVAFIIQEMGDDNDKIKMIKQYELEPYQAVNAIKTCSSSTKVSFVLNERSLKSYDIMLILSSCDAKSIGEFIKENQKFILEHRIEPYEIVSKLPAEEQKHFVNNLENLGLDLNQKRCILATLKDEVKNAIDVENLPIEYKTALSMEKTQSYSLYIKFDSDRDLEDYSGLDNLINIRPEELTNEQKKRFLELCDICPDAKVSNEVRKDSVSFFSSAKEYKEAEEWINSVIDSLNPEWSSLQKLAAIDNAIGKKISYAPDFDTEVFDNDSARALWKIISTGHGVCNGIARVEKEILDRVGIESKVISSGTHAFLKIKNIEVPLANGENAIGNTIVDPTWNLTDHRYGARPSNFCVSYEEIRKNDIDNDGKDQKCHLNDDELQDATLNLDEKNLRMLYTSIGLADKDGNFPIGHIIDISNKIDSIFANNAEGNVNAQLSCLAKYYPDFAECQNSTMSLLSGILLDHPNLNFNQCVVNRVYNREDEEKKPTFYAYIDYANGAGKKFYVANKEEGRFDEYGLEEFEKQFECYEMDLERNNGVRPWERGSRENENIDLSRSSGKVAADENYAVALDASAEEKVSNLNIDMNEEGREV